jgi:hypothetical protein
MKSLRTWIGCIFTLLLASGCEPNVAPPANYMKCKLNGFNWQSLPDEVGAIYASTGQMVTFGGDDGTILISANISGVSSLGTYALGPATNGSLQVYMNSQFYYINTNFGSGNFYLDEIKNPDLTRHNIKGRFEGMATNLSNDTIFITEGEIENF